MRKARESQILELLSQCGRMEVSVLAQRLGVSQVTVRKDLDALEERGILRREHGFAVSGSGDDVNNRLAIHYEEKRRIARRAARLVSPGETVMIESGSCCALLAEEIAHNKPGATIITNSAFIASYISRVDGARTHPQGVRPAVLCGTALCGGGRLVPRSGLHRQRPPAGPGRAGHGRARWTGDCGD